MPEIFFLSSLSHCSTTHIHTYPPFLPPSLPPYSSPFCTLILTPSAPPGLGDYSSGYTGSRTFASPEYTNFPPYGHVEHPCARQNLGASWIPTLKMHYRGSEPERAPEFEHVQASEEVGREDGEEGQAERKGTL